MQHRVFETDFAGRKLIVETGKYAEQAGGACFVRCGDTVVMAAATCADKPREGIDFFPLSVDFEEKLYSVGRIPGGFIKREGRPSEKAVLTSRLIDRPLRPLFPKGYYNDVQIIVTCLSVGYGYPAGGIRHDRFVNCPVHFGNTVLRADRLRDGRICGRRICGKPG